MQWSPRYLIDSLFDHSNRGGNGNLRVVQGQGQEALSKNELKVFKKMANETCEKMVQYYTSPRWTENLERLKAIKWRLGKRSRKEPFCAVCHEPV
ncbi:hypothetical protein V865_006898 [Kwoniella europaea PYCC6329]|uniref:Uncharacterized protein n=1 Tax=Kwoniella europaea PYCC6329 TaxID=1423913 RepID=A0AAX4KT98_9TREE